LGISEIAVLVGASEDVPSVMMMWTFLLYAFTAATAFTD
jgi:hypothetical protein